MDNQSGVLDSTVISSVTNEDITDPFRRLRHDRGFCLRFTSGVSAGQVEPETLSSLNEDNPWGLSPQDFACASLRIFSRGGQVAIP